MAPTHHSHWNTGTGASGTIRAQQSRRSSAGEWRFLAVDSNCWKWRTKGDLLFSSTFSSGVFDGSNSSPVSWPALSESTKASPKSPFSDSLKTLSDGSVSVSQGTGTASAFHRDNSHRDGGQWGGFGSQSHGANSNRRGNCCPHPRGDQNQDWKPHTRRGNMPPQRVPARPFIPHTYPPFIPTLNSLGGFVMFLTNDPRLKHG
ncbi:hypothetical protein HAX54_014599 [Datura stramonium]|uniref:Uncharacterized protein n=1 Tax=Datura stramonium TaxID=4076 RepID=A0ABS8S2A0_DATST|nr:hypothetical protein [Datura stramonium]